MPSHYFYIAPIAQASAQAFTQLKLSKPLPGSPNLFQTSKLVSISSAHLILSSLGLVEDALLILHGYFICL